MIDLVIVGAGIAGLSAAWELTRRGHAPVIIEEARRPGGLIHTEKVNGFIIDAGPDSLLVQKPAGVTLCRELGLGDRLQPTSPPRTAYIVRRGRLVPLPETAVLGIPTSVGPFLTTPLFSWPAKVRMGLEWLVPRRRDGGEEESIGGFMRRRFGAEAVEYLADPLLAGIHAGDVERLSMRALFPRLLEAEQASGSVLRSLRAARRPPGPEGAFVSLAGGLGELVDTLAARLPSDSLRCGDGAAQVVGHGPFVVTLKSGRTVEARALIVAAPAWAAAGMLERVDQELAAGCGAVPYVSSATVAFGVRREQIAHPLEGTGFLVPRSERRALLAATWVSSKWPGRAPDGTALLRAFVGGAYDPHVLDRTDEELARLAYDELAARLALSGDPMLTRVYRWPRASAQHEVGHHARLARIDARLDALPGLFMTGSGLRGVGIPDCVADGRATAGRAAAFIERER